MSDLPPSPSPSPSGPAVTSSRAGRDLPKAIASGVGLGVMIIASLVFYSPLFMVVVAGAVMVAIWELHQGLAAHDIDLPQAPVMLGGVVMVGVAYLFGADALVTATAVSALITMLWLLRRGVEGYVRNATASVFTLVYVPFLASFVGLLLSERLGVEAVVTFILVTVSSDIGGYAVGVRLGRHPMAPVISPKKSWEGFAGSAATCVLFGLLTVTLLLDGPWWVGVVLGLVTVVMATLGDLCESVMKRDLGIKDMSQLIPGHGGLMDRLDSLLATVAPAWLLLHYLVF